MKSIKTKLIVVMLLLSVSLLSAMQVFSIYTQYSQSGKSIENTKKILLENYDRMIAGQVKNIVSLIDRMEKVNSAKGLALSERQQYVKEVIRNIRYAEDGYFWIDDYEGNNILMPPSPQSEGKNRLGMKDVKGYPLIKYLIENGIKDGGGFTEYWFPRIGQTEALPKRSYTLAYKSYKWVVGTGNYIDDIDKEIAKLREAAMSILYRSVIVSAVVFAFAVAVAIAVAILFGRSIANPIVEISAFIKKMSDGDLTARINRKHLNRKDEVGRMVADMRELRNALIDIMSSIRVISDELSASSEETASAADSFSENSQKQAAAVEEINATIEEVTAGVTTIHGSAKEQLGSTELLSKSVKTLKDIEKNIENTVQSISKLSDDISGRADEGNNSLKTMQKRFGEISQSSGRMLDVVNVITDIADQINLLSLNAAIESARAGEAGKGFAVVADEISKLADETATNVKTIQQNIVLNDEKIKQGEVIVNDSLEKLKAVIEGVRQIAESLRSVEDEVGTQADTSNVVNGETTQVKQKSEEIQAAIGEQNLAMEEITSTIGNINLSVQATAAGAEEIAGSSQEIARMSQNLQSKLSVFKIPEKGELS